MTEKDHLRRVLSSVLDAQVSLGAHGDQAWPVTVPDLAPSVQFKAIWVRRGWPSDVRRAIGRAPGATLVVAPAFSPGARHLLEARGLSWADETGGARIQAPGLIVRLDGEPMTEPKPREVSWSPIAVRAAESVLALAPAQITTGWLAEHAKCSVPRASGILQQWDGEGWTSKRGPARGRGASRAVDQAHAMLDAWTAHLNAAPLDRWFAHTTNRDLLAVQNRIIQAFDGLTFAWTGWPGAEELAPFVTQLPVLHLRVTEAVPRRDIESALRKAGLTMTDDAGRVELWRTNADAFDYGTASARGPLCSWPRVYADLVRIGGRGVDAAEHLRDVMNAGR
jgi:hypothetical protein